LKYGQEQQKKGGSGKSLFYSAVVTVAIGVIAYYYLKPHEFDIKDGCPINAENILHRNVVIVDTTDPIREGKQADIELIIREFASTNKPVFQWINEGKKADQTSIFLLSDTAPVDMKPVAKFCSQPPSFLLQSSSTGAAIRKNIESVNSHISGALQILLGGKSSAQSPIIETLSIITSSPSYWRQGSTLILVSDLMQNTSKCGFFDSMSVIPNYSKSPSSCIQSLEVLNENLRPTSTYQEPTVVAICELPSALQKSGKIQYWRELFQKAMGYDVSFTCDPKSILARRTALVEILRPN